MPAMSFAASANVIARLRAEPVFVDIDLDSRNLDLIGWSAPSRRAPAPSCRCIFPGLPVDMDALYATRRRTLACGSSRTRRTPSVRATGTGRSAASAT